MYKVGVLSIGDRASRGAREDESGKTVIKIAETKGFKVVNYEIVADEKEQIKKVLISWCDDLKLDLILTTGGTGLGPRDVTPESTEEVIEKKAEGIPEAMRVLCLHKSPRAVLSRLRAGVRNKTLIINLPGSVKGAKESLEAVIDTLSHGLEMIRGGDHSS